MIKLPDQNKTHNINKKKVGIINPLNRGTNMEELYHNELTL